MTEDYCPLCNSSGNVHDPEKHNLQPYNPVKDVVRKTLLAHIPSLTDEDDAEIDKRVAEQMLPTTLLGDGIDNADLALRTCACGKKIDGYYSYVDHLVAVFGVGESHLGG